MGTSVEKLEDVQRAQARVGVRQAAVDWGLRFVDTDLSLLLASEQAVLSHELYAFAHQLGYSHDHVHVEPFDLNLMEAQQVLRDIFQRAAARQSIDTPLRGTPRLVWMGDRHALIQYDNEHLLTDVERLQVAAIRLLDRLPHGYVINACQAPRLRQKAPCGRLFLTNKSIQRYCSPTCQQRAHHRRNRQPHPQTAPV